MNRAVFMNFTGIHFSPFCLLQHKGNKRTTALSPTLAINICRNLKVSGLPRLIKTLQLARHLYVILVIMVTEAPKISSQYSLVFRWGSGDKHLKEFSIARWRGGGHLGDSAS